MAKETTQDMEKTAFIVYAHPDERSWCSKTKDTIHQALITNGFSV